MKKYVGCVFPYQYVNPNYHIRTARTCANLLKVANQNSLPRPNPQEYHIECDCIPGFGMNYKGFCIEDTRCNQWEAFGIVHAGATNDAFHSEQNSLVSPENGTQNSNMSTKSDSYNKTLDSNKIQNNTILKLAFGKFWQIQKLKCFHKTYFKHQYLLFR